MKDYIKLSYEQAEKLSVILNGLLNCAYDLELEDNEAETIADLKISIDIQLDNILNQRKAS